MSDDEAITSIYFEGEDMGYFLSVADPNSEQKKSQNINPLSNEESLQSKLSLSHLSNKSGNKSTENDDNILIPEDFEKSSISSSFIYNDIFDNLKNKIHATEKELNECNINTVKLSDKIFQNKSIEELIENTYGYQTTNIPNQLEEECAYLKKIICFWRRVCGDGNCFYRSVVFGWLEYLVFNMKVDAFKFIIIDLYSKFSENYPNTKILPYGIKKSFANFDKDVVVLILQLIINKLEENVDKKTKIKNAYIILIKGFNFCKRFDYCMILYLRYLLYELILNNQNKLFSKDFPILLGDLLPEKYIIDEGKFNFDKYFHEDLLKFYTCAEKIAVFLTPYVIKVNLKVIMYDFGDNCDIQSKLFECRLPNRDKELDTVYVMFRKAHYDLCYGYEYYNQYKEYIDIFTSHNFSTYCINIDKVNQIYNEIMFDQITDSKIYNKKVVDEKNKNNKVIILQKKYSTNNQTSNDNNNDKKEKPNIELNDIINKIQQLSKCIVCKASIPNNSKCNSPCECEIGFCSNKCKEDYFNRIYSFINGNLFDENNKFVCPKCKNIYNIQGLCDLIKSISTNFDDGKNLKNAFKNKLLESFSSYCMSCKRKFGKDEKKMEVYCKCTILSYILDTSKFNHFLCKQCKDKNINICSLCGLYHFKLKE